MDFNAWLRIEGDTPKERVRNGYRQFIVVGALSWAGALVVWEVLSLLIGPAAAGVVVVVLGVYVALDLRDRMIGPLDDPDDSESGAGPDEPASDLESDDRAASQGTHAGDTDPERDGSTDAPDQRDGN